MSPLAAGYDIKTTIDFTVDPGGCVLVPTGFALGLPPGWEAQIRPRSGLAGKRRLTIPNSPGTIDADYRGPVKVLIQNYGIEAQSFERGDRIAQMVIKLVPDTELDVVDELDETERADGGF